MTIREAHPEDAPQILAHVHALADEPNNMVAIGPGEFTVTLEQEQELLAHYASSDNSIYLVAEVDDKIVGILICMGGKRQSQRHSASLGMSVNRERRNQGIGTALMNHVIEWAQATGILKRLELEVYENNARAIHLYRKFGFIEEGRRRRAYFKDGHFVDSLIMARLY